MVFEWNFYQPVWVTAIYCLHLLFHFPSICHPSRPNSNSHLQGFIITKFIYATSSISEYDSIISQYKALEAFISGSEYFSRVNQTKDPSTTADARTSYFSALFCLSSSSRALISSLSPSSSFPRFSSVVLLFFPVNKSFNHLFSLSNCAILVSKISIRSPICLVLFSKACSRCFFLVRKRADAAVFRSRLTCSSREISSSERLKS